MSFSESNHNHKQFNFLRGSITIIEGQIGVGKTTLGKSLTSVLENAGIPSVFYPETIHNPWLQAFLADMSKHGLGYELFCTSARMLTYEKAKQMKDRGYACIIDRSLDGDMVFAKSLRNQGIITEEEFEIAESWSNCVNNTGIEPPDYLIYLRTLPDIAIQRTAKRNRDGEDMYDLAYFTEIHKGYDNAMDNINPNRHKLCVDWSKEIDLDEDDHIPIEYVNDLIQKLRDGMESFKIDSDN